MVPLQMDRVRRLRESGIGKRAGGNCHEIGRALQLSERRRTAVGTEVEDHRESAVSLAGIEAGSRKKAAMP
jgi:hypothetical protein